MGTDFTYTDARLDSRDPYCIDWERAARDLRMDYMSCEIDGHTYWYR